MKRVATILAVSVLTAATMVAWRGMADDAPAPAAAGNPAIAKLSQPARDIVKMSVSGVPDDVIKSFINGSPAVFNLTPDNIINLQGVGVTASITTTMLNHDKGIRDNAPVMPPTMPGQMPPQPGAQYPQPVDQPAQTVYQPAVTQPVYDYTDLSPYGSWNYVTDYGWCWQPFGWLGYNYYPWGLLSWGRWWNCPGRGWCWFPGSHFRSPGFAGGGRQFFNGRSGGFSHASVGFNHGTAGFGRGSSSLSRPASFGHTASVSHAFAGVRSGRSAGFSASHFGGGGGSHFSGGGHSGGGGHAGGHR